MAVDLSGRDFPAVEHYLVTAPAIREFAAAIGEDDARCHDSAAARAAGYPDLVAPPTFGIVPAFAALGALFADATTGIALSHILHTEQRFTHARPIVAGDVLRVDFRVESVRSRGGTDVIAARTDITAADGSAVCTAHTTLLHRSAAGT